LLVPGTSPGFTVLGGKFLFVGINGNGNFSLWISDGTAGGTRELIVPGLEEPTGYLAPLDTNKVLFSGSGLDGTNLWVTDGTSAGTVEIKPAGAYPELDGLDPQNITVLGNKAFFTGVTQANQIALWVTNGTAAGTRPVVQSAAFNTLGPDDFTLFGNRLLFAAYDSLWITDGTSGGTLELAAGISSLSIA
jgi:ELWxxDGT repeat protein